MKIHSYLMVNRMLRIEKEAGTSLNDPDVIVYPNNVTIHDFFMFLWFPTLIYQTSYPRTKNIRWGFVCKRFLDTILCIVYTYAIWVRYCVPVLGEMNGGYEALILGIFKVMMPGIAVSLIGFYGVLHSWLNGFAELTRFADRHFYSDWWNVTNWAAYYRKWNYVVHNFLHRHVFMDCVVSLNMSKSTAMWTTFLLSALFHEYVLATCMGFWKPIMFLMFTIPGVLFIYLTKLMKNSPIWNVFMWAMLIIGHGMLFGLYSRAWHFHYNVPGHQHSWLSLVWIV